MSNKKDTEYIRKWANKIRAIGELGGKCSNCEISETFCLQFHHLKNKTHNIARLITGRWSLVQEEIQYCQLLCANCHVELLYKGTRPDRIRKKQDCFDYLNVESCMRCDYKGRNQGSLSFHHLKEKQCNISYLIGNNTPVDVLNTELNKCIVLCANCHAKEHVDITKFERFKSRIYHKVQNYTEKQSKLNRNEVKRLFDSGVKQVDIAKQFNASKSTISLILKG